MDGQPWHECWLTQKEDISIFFYNQEAIHAEKLFYVGIDVDDKSFHVAVLCRISNDLQEFKCAPNITSLLKKLSKFESDRLVICYEASMVGHSTLFQQLLSRSDSSIKAA